MVRFFIAACVALPGLIGRPAAALDLDEAFARASERVGVPRFALRLSVTADATRTVAMSAQYVPGACLVLALRNSPYIEGLLAGLDPIDRPIALEAMFAHEIGHCEERHAHASGRIVPDSAIQLLARISASRDERGAIRLKPLPHRELWGEIFADAYMGVYLTRYHRAAAARVMAVQLAERARNAAVDPGHDTSTSLAGRSFDAAPEESLLQAAWRIRRAGVTRPQP